ncbi:MAG: DUF350 domain-containing protein [Thermincola sp.]|jgi:putative membrane protein|nr:DUF350 domain-containing protein [Thermincola sp.]MDT3702024.1 DUF350 domain-containing protein [Thermincola sp.]
MSLTSLLINYLIYFGLSTVLMVLGVVIFVLTTKTREFALIGQDNKAAGIVVAGRTVGLAIILYAAIANSVSPLDLAIWAGIGIVTQVIANFLAELLTPNFNVEKALEQENVAVAIVLLGMFVSIGLVIAGCMTY